MFLFWLVIGAEKAIEEIKLANDRMAMATTCTMGIMDRALDLNITKRSLIKI